MHISACTAIMTAVLLTACAPSTTSTTFDPEDPAAIAEIEAIMETTMAGSRDADAGRVLAMAEGGSDLTFITADVMLTGLETIRAAFEDTYAGVASQTQTVLERRIRLLSPDVAVLTAISEGTYTDNAGWTSDPVGMGFTIVFVREDGTWRARHAHQSTAP
ncbi:MAG: SgcJ/EcaC family oxidoreductase [Gemmatimonadota bacterium]|nr:SgcJ/EcaC family oxidoreductase [Gemmatimonadota bacterium]